MNIATIKQIYRVLKTSDNMSYIRAHLHKYCDGLDFNKVLNEYLLNDDILIMINYIKKEYDSMIDAEKSVYKISLEELAVRIDKLKKLEELFNSCDNPYIRFDRMSKMFRNPNVLHKSYVLLIRYGNDDPKLDEIRPILNKFDIYYREFRDFFKNDIHKTVANAYKEENNFDKYYYAKFIINEYLRRNDSYNFDEFLADYGINEDIFKELLKNIRNNDEDLYLEYLGKKSNNDILLNNNSKYILDDLAYAITNNMFIYGNNFDLLEFIKLVPFKNSSEFSIDIDEFMKKHNMYSREIIMNYIFDNNLYKQGIFKEYDIDKVITNKAIVDGKELSINDMNLIVNYLIKRNIPICKASIVTAARMYNDNIININLDNQFALRKTKPIIIPPQK